MPSHPAPQFPIIPFLDSPLASSSDSVPLSPMPHPCQGSQSPGDQQLDEAEGGQGHIGDGASIEDPAEGIPPLIDPADELDEDDLYWRDQLDLSNALLGRRDPLEELLGRVSPTDPMEEGPSSAAETQVNRGPITVAVAWPRSKPRSSSPSPSPPQLPQHRSAEEVYKASHPFWFGRLILVTVAFLHFTFHLPFSACNLLLSIISTLFLALHTTSKANSIPTTLATVIKRLDLEDRFTVVPSCPNCRKLFPNPISDPSDFICPTCLITIFRPPTESVSNNLQELLGIRKRSDHRQVPKVMVPLRKPSDLLVEFLAQDGMEEKMDTWRLRDRSQEGLLQDMMDGRIWKNLKDQDGNAFFGDTTGEVRIGVTVNLDWFDFTRSANSPSHSTGVVSMCIANLDAAERYRTKNLLVPLVIPGPKEPTAEQLQEYLGFIADDLLLLYNDGVTLQSGRTARVAVVVVICDHPAMCKFGGFADKNHLNAPCTRCTVRLREMFSEEAMRGGFPSREAENFRQQAMDWEALDNQAKRDEHFKEHGVRAFAFSRLPYFDPIRMMVVDPMHNLLLGVVKSQWYNVWVQQTSALRANTKKSKRELHDVHTLLAKVEVPSWMGRLPVQIGEPAGGSLSADEWKTLALTVGPLILPIVFEDWKEISDGEQARFRAKNPTKEPPQARIVEGEMENFLLLSASLSILLARTIRIDDLGKAHNHLVWYLVKFRELYGEAAVKPNHHWSTHIHDQILDYGPVYGFWAFLQERLNYTMKNFKTNNRSGGGLEVTLMRSFEASIRLRRLLLFLATFDDVVGGETSEEEPEIVRAVIKQLLADRSIARGTVEVMAARDTELDAREILQLGLHSALDTVEPLYNELVSYFNSHPECRNQPIYTQHDPTVGRNAFRMSPRFATFNYIIIDGRRMVPAAAQRAGSQPTLVGFHLANLEPSYRVAELLQLLQPVQAGLPNRPLACVRWLKASSDYPLQKDVWGPHRETLGLGVWVFNEYDSTLSPIIECSTIIAPVARVPARAQKGSAEQVWLTISLDKHGASF